MWEGIEARLVGDSTILEGDCDVAEMINMVTPQRERRRVFCIIGESKDILAVKELAGLLSRKLVEGE